MQNKKLTKKQKHILLGMVMGATLVYQGSIVDKFYLIFKGKMKQLYAPSCRSLIRQSFVIEKKEESPEVYYKLTGKGRKAANNVSI